MSLTVDEIKQKKSKLEANILKDLRALESSSDLKISYVEVNIDRHSYDEEEKMRKDGKKLRTLKGVIDVRIELNIADDPRSIDMPKEVRG